MIPFTTTALDTVIEVTAPDGSLLHPLGGLPGQASFAHFSLPAGQVSRAVSHTTVAEIWYVLGGSGRLWRRQGTTEAVVALRAGVCLTVPLGTTFQFRADPGDEPLRVVAATVPPWPADDAAEARTAEGIWPVALTLS